MLFQSPFQKWPDFHTFSVSLPKLARFSYLFSLHLLICQFFILFLLVKISQIFIPFSVSFLKLAAKFHNFFSVLAKIGHIFVLFSKFVSFSYFFLLFKIYQMFILFQSPCQNWSEFCTVSVSNSILIIFCIFILYQCPSQNWLDFQTF